MNVLFNATPPIPALNRWTKLYPVVAWFACGLLMNGLLETAFNEAQSKVIGARAEEDAVLDLAFAEDDVVVGLAADLDQLLFQPIQRLRFRKTAAFLRSPSTPQTLCVLYLALQPGIALMSSAFEKSRT